MVGEIAFFSLSPNLSNVLMQSGANICYGDPTWGPPLRPPFRIISHVRYFLLFLGNPTILCSVMNPWCASHHPGTLVHRCSPTFATRTISFSSLRAFWLSSSPTVYKSVRFCCCFLELSYKRSEKPVDFPFTYVIVMPTATCVIAMHASGKFQRGDRALQVGKDRGSVLQFIKM